MVLKLDTLAEELLTRIVSFVEPHSSLWSLTLVSRTLNRLATPYLYKTVDFKGGSPDTGITYLIPFAFLTFQKPHIASFVRCLSIRDAYGTPKRGLDPLEGNDSQNEKDESQDVDSQDSKKEQSEYDEPQDDEDEQTEGRGTPGDDDGKSDNSVTKGDRDTESSPRKGWPDHPDRDRIIRSAIEGIGYTSEEVDERLAALLAGDDESVVLSILLPHLKKLCRLDIRHDWMGYEDSLVSTLRKASKREKPFNQGDHFSFLTDILVASYSDKYLVSPIMLGACLGLPALRRLHALKMRENDQYEATEKMTEILKGSSWIEEIELRESKLCSEDLKLLLSTPKALKTFIYDVGHSWAWYPVDTNDILEGLSLHADSLENLVLDHPDFVEEMEGDNFAPLEFSAFTRLEYLKASVLFLGGSSDIYTCSLKNTFPRSLKKLYVTYCWEVGECQPVMHELRQLLELKEQCLPNLEVLVLEGEFKAHPETLELVKDIMRCVSDKSVRIEVVEDAYGRGYSGGFEKGWGIDETIEWQPTLANAVGEKKILEIELASDSDSNSELA